MCDSYPRNRRGISLMEVLISAFILAVGLLGVASLIPIAGFQAAEASRNDRAATIGRSALSDVKLRGLLNPAMWAGVNDPNDPNDPFLRNTATQPFMIDPLGSVNLGIPRVNLRAWPDPSAPAMTPELAKHIFRSHDDLSVSIPAASNDVSQQVFLPADVDPSAGTVIKRASEHEYSWMVTVSPAGDPTSALSRQNELLLVSIVVFFQRASDAVSERTIGASVVGGKLPNGRVVLAGDAKNVRENDWLLLTGSNLNQWYRVVTIARHPGGGGYNATVAGPDRDKAVTGAVLFDRVIGVYEYSMRREELSQWIWP